MSYPVSDDKKIDMLNYVLCDLIQRKEVNFCIEGQTLFAQEVSGHFGCLPLLINEASEVFESIFSQSYNINDLAGSFLKSIDPAQAAVDEKFLENLSKVKTSKTLPIDYIEDESAYFNCVPVVNTASGSVPFTFLLHFSHYALEAYIDYYLKNEHLLVNSSIPLDALYSKWKNAIAANKVKISKAKVVSLPVPSPNANLSGTSGG